MEYNFKPHVKGDTFLGAEFQVSDGAEAIDLTNYRIRMHLRRQASPSASLVMAFDTEDETIEIHEPAEGRFRIPARVIDVPAFNYKHDIEFTNGAGRVRTWVRGVFPVVEEVTYD